MGEPNWATLGLDQAALLEGVHRRRPIPSAASHARPRDQLDQPRLQKGPSQTNRDLPCGNEAVVNRRRFIIELKYASIKCRRADAKCIDVKAQGRGTAARIARPRTLTQRYHHTRKPYLTTSRKLWQPLATPVDGGGKQKWIGIGTDAIKISDNDSVHAEHTLQTRFAICTPS